MNLSFETNKETILAALDDFKNACAMKRINMNNMNFTQIVLRDPMGRNLDILA